ncbi:hypothetical protein [Ferviditalea candida]|uniref:Uncharacterized protein n=1 Tax=Ferviditalea candida TaxID=3108399 RepID=A0ABU5ZM58_9BACL|nr:hypothetical protein [Paenibacillaceae bacterium T2]
MDGNKPKEEKVPRYFYFDLADEHHRKLMEEEMEEHKEDPLKPLENITRVEY